MDQKYSLCAPSQAGAATGAVTGLVVWALVAYVPAFHNGVPLAVVGVLPFALAWLGHVAAAWAAGPRSPAPAGAGAGAATGFPGSPVSPQPGAGGSADVRLIPLGTAGTEGAPPSAVPSAGTAGVPPSAVP